MRLRRGQHFLQSGCFLYSTQAVFRLQPAQNAMTGSADTAFPVLICGNGLSTIWTNPPIRLNVVGLGARQLYPPGQADSSRAA